MTSVVHKYEVPIDDAVHTFVINASELTPSFVGMQESNIVCLWAEKLYDKENTDERIEFSLKIVGTGETWNEDEWELVGSCQDDMFVWHLLWKLDNE